MENSELDWEDLSSSHVSRMAYDADQAELYIQFNTGAVYKYPSDPSEAQGLRDATSPGRFVLYFLRGKGERVE